MNTPSGLREINLAPGGEEATVGDTGETGHGGGVGHRGLTDR